ncbi:hypothetical protein M409DRAFT_64201 [Zasmidium cellare ATCC 36951]|uniref:Terpene synthase n=1 Tax=Zasmidium cellare ATCC 36951 TaxID=1080233 RepID=A0A6A6CUT3_ZASCE|nr:uncharacterized protein M409DRAFT_64201 [Zasmidium cellare ATCC 36951]KAF2170473.1 hypothetical protein M409DRAFT_64201 [Zasmidium cellare ATCC 36951]
MASLEQTQLYDLLETQQVPRCFSRFPAGVNIAAKHVENALAKIALQASQDGSRERRRALIRHSNPYGNAFAVCHCSADPERLEVIASLIEVMWIHDDVTEEMEHSSECRQHAILSRVVQVDIDGANFPAENIRQKTLAVLLRKAIDMDAKQAVKMVETLQIYLRSFDSRDDDFDSVQEYMPYRVSNCGYWISSYFIRWGMGIELSQEDYQSIESFDIAMGNVLGLTNDYFSWNVEKDQPTDRIRNAVRVLMKEHGIESGAAQMMLLGIIIEEESRAATLKQDRLKSSVSEELRRYFEAIELYVGGSCYWHATAPRYQIFE